MSTQITITVDESLMDRLNACAEWRNHPVEELVRLYVEDWVAIDYPESQGRLTRRGLYRDGPDPREYPSKTSHSR